MLEISIDEISLQSLYNLRQKHYKCLNYSEWFFAMQKVEFTLVEIGNYIYLTEAGIQYFNVTNYAEIYTT